MSSVTDGQTVGDAYVSTEQYAQVHVGSINQ